VKQLTSSSWDFCQERPADFAQQKQKEIEKEKAITRLFKKKER